MYKTETLPNDVRILRIPNKNIKLIVFQINMKIGSDIETADMLECCHFFEHLFSMYTSTKYPSSKINTETLDFKSIESNAEVIEKQISFTLYFHKQNIDYVIDLVSNTIIDFKIDESIFDSEKNAVIEELNEIIKDADYNFNTKINKKLYKNHVREYSEKQRLENVKKISIKDIENFYKKYFTSQNYIISIFGNFDTKNYNLLKKNMLKFNNINKYIYTPYSLVLKDHIVFYKKDSKISNLKIIFKINYTIFNNEMYTIIALMDILSGGLNSLLLKKLRNENGLVYYCNSYTKMDYTNENISTISIETICNTNNLLKVIKIILDTLKNIKTNLIDDLYIKSYKNNINLEKEKDKDFKQLDFLISHYSQYYLWNKPIINPNKYYYNAKKFSSKDLLNISNKIFIKQNMLLCYDGLTKMNMDIDPIIDSIDL